MSLTEDDKDILRYAAAHGCEPGCRCRSARRDIADHLRRRFPHMPDADLAAVLISVAGPVAVIADVNAMSGRGAAAFMAGVAVELAALEIGGDP